MTFSSRTRFYSFSFSYPFLLFVLLLLLKPSSAFIAPRNSCGHGHCHSHSTPHVISATKKPRWQRPEGVNEGAERFESVKTAIVSAVGGSIIAAPVSIVGALASGGGFDGAWEFSTDMLAVTLALFGVTYRYAVRLDDNPMLKQGVVGAFALTRTLNLIRINTDVCTALPLNCGDPLGYVSYDMIRQGLIYGSTSFVAFGAAAILLEQAFERKIIGKFE